MKVFLNGKFVSEKDAKISVFDAAFTSGYGIYETILVDKGRVFDLNKHIDRLFESARLIFLKLPWTKSEVKKWVCKFVTRNKLRGLTRLRITASFGADMSYTGYKTGPQIVIFAIPMKKTGTKNIYRVITYDIERILPEAKTTCLLPQYLARRKMVSKKANEVLLVNHNGEITEGSVTNVFFAAGGVLITPKNGILNGTMRVKIINVAKKLGIKVYERSVKRVALKIFDECFVTNSLVGIAPVLRIDGIKISDRIGPLTKKIRDYVCKKSS